MTEISRRLFLQVTGTGTAAVTGLLVPGSPAFAGPDDGIPVDEGVATVKIVGSTVTLANNALKVVLSRAAGSLSITSLLNVAAAKQYQSVAAGKRLFSYTLDGSSTVNADDGGWTIAAPAVSPITMYAKQGNVVLGKQVRLTMTRTTPKPLTVTAVFEIYDGRSGLRFYTLIRNNNGAAKLTVTNSTVFALGVADAPHTLHYVPNQIWKSTRGGLAPTPEDTSTPAKRAELPKKMTVVFDAGHGFSVSPEINWKTQRGHGTLTADYMLPPFASLDAWSSVDFVKVVSNPTALQLSLFPNEEFEYLSVNVSVFKGDLVDGRMAEGEHFRRRFRYNNTSTIFHTNDFDYRFGAGRTLPPDYYYTTIIPKAKAAGIDMVMLDDLWNTTRDTIEPSDDMKLSIHSLAEFSQTLTDNGLLFGLWFSLSGGGHGQGRDLADPVNVAFKRGQIETLITQYHMTHQMIDLTEWWQNEEATTYSGATDNVYRKAVMSRRLMNEMVQAHPHLLPKMTSELDIAPTQGDRNCELMHCCHNGWHTANGGVTGENLSLRTALTGFGHLPMESTYMNIGAMSGKMEDYYSYLAVRAVKFPKDPGNEADWPPPAIALMAKFNAWRKSARVKALAEQPFRPVYFGPGWDTSTWDSSVGPYVWLRTDEGRNTALVVATGVGGAAFGASVNLRWLDDAATYTICDVTLDDSGAHSYAYRGTWTGAAIKSAGFPIDLRANTSRGKVFWASRAPSPGLRVGYADENVATFTSAVAGGRLTVGVTGAPGATAALIVADTVSNKGLVKTVVLDGAGAGTVTATAADLVPPQPVGTFFALPQIFQAESLTRTLTPSTVASSEVAEANASNGRWVLASFTAAGQRVDYTVDVPAAGSYEIEVRFKENANRGRSQPTLDGEPLGGVVDHLYPGRVFGAVEFRTRVLGVREFTAGAHTFGFTCAGTSGASMAVGVDYVKLSPTLNRTRLVFEAESSSVASSQPLTTVNEAAASGGAFQVLPATAVGAWVEYRVTAPRAGRYRLMATTKRTPARGQARPSIDGEDRARVVDFFLPSSAGDYQYLEEDLGFVTFAAAGSKTVRFTVTGRASGSTSFQLAVDNLTLTPVGALSLTGPATVAVGEAVTPSVDALDMDVYADPKYLLFSVDGANEGGPAYVDSAGKVVGHAPGTAILRVRSQVDGSVAASAPITVTA